MAQNFDVIIVGSGPAGLGAAFHLARHSHQRILVLDKAKISSGGLRNDCKQNYTFPVGFPKSHWSKDRADKLLHEVARTLKPKYESRENIQVYKSRAERLGVDLLEVRQAHVGTDKAVKLINSLISQLKKKGVKVQTQTEMASVQHRKRQITLKNGVKLGFENLVLAPGRAGFEWLQDRMKELSVEYIDNVVDIGVRIETREDNYHIVKDYYDPKFMFPDDVRTFCTNSGAAYVVQEKYNHYFSVNGHSFSSERKSNGLANFAMLRTVRLTDPVVSGHQFADILGQMAMKLGGGRPMMQRVGDFRLGKRSKATTFNDDLFDFRPTLRIATPGDVSLAMPAKILRAIWRSLKLLDTIVPGTLHPGTIIYYPEIKTYANNPAFVDRHFRVKDGVYIIGDGAGTSRGITAAWASGIRAAKGILGQ